MKPNIVIVMTDQQRADLRKSQGYPLDTMPFLDSFAREGFEFDRAYTPNPCCLPARVSMMTGRYPSCHQVRTNHNVKDVYAGEDMTGVLKKAGYVTALCGKNHTYLNPSQDFDFARTSGHLSGGGEVNETAEQIEFAEFLQETKHMEMHRPSPGGVEVQHPFRNVSSAFEFLDTARDPEKPFFLWLSFAEPHNPYQVPEPYYDMFPPESLPPLHTTAEDCVLKGPDYVWERKCWEQVLGPDIDGRIARMRSNYLGMLRLIDDQFRRFVEGLDARGLRENTVILFLSDHGDLNGEYGLLRKGVSLPEVLIRIPFILQGPGFEKGVKDTEHFVNIVDILPTVCELTGEKIPFGSQGRSVVPLLHREPVPEKEFAVGYSECGYGGLYWTEEDHLTVQDDKCITDGTTFQEMSSWTQSGQKRALRKGDFKLQTDMMGKSYLYDLRSDPYELHNLFDDPDYAAVKADMVCELLAMVLRADDPFPAPRNRYRSKVHPRGYWFDGNFIAEDPGVPAGSAEDFVKRKD